MRRYGRKSMGLVKFIGYILLLNIFQLFNIELRAQDATMGHFTSQPWVVPGPTNFGIIKYIAGGGIATQNTRVCNSGSSDVNALIFNSNNSHFLQIDIPDHAIKSYIINLLGSSGGSSPAQPGVVFASDPSFAPGTIIDAVLSAPAFINNTSDCAGPVTITPPSGTVSVRLYRRVDYWAADKRIETAPNNTGRTQVGSGQTFRLANAEVWATATPTVQAHNINFSNITTTSLGVNWVRGNGSAVVVFAKEGTGVITNPEENTAYTASADWKSGSPTGTQLGVSGYYCVYNGAGTDFSLSNLKPNTQYTLQAFEYTSAPSQLKYLTTTALGNPATAPTKPLSLPIIETRTVTDILSNKATSGSVNLYDGGLAITDKGLVWGTAAGPSLTNNTGKFSAGGGDSSDFTDFIKGLTPETKYYVRAYAINSMGTTYGNEQEFTTAAPAPVLIAIPGAIDFGENYFNSNALTISYNLSGQNLSPASGNITITAPAGFLVSLRGNTGFAQSIILPYTNNRVNNTAIYVQLPATVYGSFAGNVVHTGGGVATVDADVVKVSGSIIQSQEELTNRGTDFWLGFGYQEKMKAKAGDAGEAKLSIYISATDQPAQVVVDLPGITGATGFPRTINVPANSVVEVTGFPTGDPNASTNYNATGLPDTRLYATGLSDKGIHVYSTNGTPVSVWMHTYANNNSAAGAMLFPTNTWSSEYVVQSYGGRTNTGIANSFFFVVANEDGTEIEFTPTNDILNADQASLFSVGHSATNVMYAKGGTYKITLNKGQVFNAMGFVSGTGSAATGLDLTGTKIKTTCNKKIAVFGGNGRVLVNTLTCSANEGSDHLIQQMFPTVAWGTKYLTVPTKNMPNNLFRVVVKDPTTIVKRNGVVLNPTTLINNLYYQLDGNQPMSIESDKPINVIQFIVVGDCGGGGDGDPEMIILSPVQQAISSSTVYSAAIKKSGGGANGHYINVIIEKEAIIKQSFKLDNIDFNSAIRVDVGGTVKYSSSLVLMKDAFKVHPQDPNYYYANFKVTSGAAHTISSDYEFNAIAYGMGDGESYGYNAGTAIKNLNSIKIAVNPDGVDTSSTAVRTGKNNPVTLRIALPHNPNLVDKIVWDTGTDPRISPSGSKDGEIDGNGKAKYEGTIDVDGRTFYIYSSPVAYQFSEEGISRITATALGTFASECGGEDIQKISVIVGRDNINFDFQTNCGNPTVNFVNSTTAMPGTTITKWAWDFGDGTTSDLQNPPAHTYNISGGYKYMAKLTTTNSVGTITADSLLVDFSGGIEPHFTMSENAVCAGATISFDPALSQVTGTTSGVPEQWTWKFGEGADVVITGAFSPIQQHTYSTPGKYPIKLILKTSTGCENVYVDTLIVGTAPIAKIDAPLTACFNRDSVSYIDKSTLTVGTINSWLWTFDDGTTSTLQNPKHKWLTPGKHTVTLNVRSAEGCDAVSPVTHEVNIFPLPVADFTLSSPLCKDSKVVFTDVSSSGSAEAVLKEWTWDFGDGSPFAIKTVSDTIGHVYSTAGTYTVRLWVKTDIGCTGDTLSRTITINPIPEPNFTFSDVCVPDGKVQFTGVNSGVSAVTSWSWSFGDGNTAMGQNPLHTYLTGGKYNVTLTVTNSAGCPVSVSKEIEVYDAPVVGFNVENSNGLCSDSPVNITNQSVVNGYGAVTKIEVFWDFVNKPAEKVTDDSPSINKMYENQYLNPLTSATATYRVLMRAYTNAGCFKEHFEDIVIQAIPSAELSPLSAVCEDSLPFVITGGRDERNLPGTGEYSGAGITTSPHFSPLLAGPGTHRIRYTYTTTSGCTSFAEQDIVVNPTPIIDLGDKIIYVKDNESVMLSPNIILGSNLTYRWSPSTYLDNPNAASPVSRPLDDIVYTLIVESPSGCKDTTMVIVNLLRELVPPNTFTPNGDNFNDVWEVKYLDTYPGATVEVYNRYGNGVFKSTRENVIWDGKFNGEDLPVGTYYYLIDPKNGAKIISGSVTIIR